jgi:thioredoxin 1
MIMNIIEVTADTFAAEVFLSNLPVLVDVWAPWCGPCNALAPVIDELADEYTSNAKICKLNADNTDDNQTILERYKILSIPTLLFFKDGNLVEQLVGTHTKEAIKTILDGLV